MDKTDLATFELAIARLREVDALLDDTDAGVCLLHLEACIAALESRIRRHGMTAEQQRAEAANDATRELGRPLSDALDN